MTENIPDPRLEPLGSSYLLESPVGSGAMGQVWRASTRDGQPVAIKVLRPELSSNAAIVTRFLQERHVLEGITEPHVVRVRDFVAEGSKLAIVMDLVEGPDLRSELNRRGTFRAIEAAQVIEGVLSGLAAIHKADVVHRDVKPENVLLVGGVPSAVRLTDFGVARIVDESQKARRTSVIGTPEYIAPEVADGEQPTFASDLYAVGIMLYELVAGVTPFAGGSPLAVLRRHADQRPVRPDGMPDGIWQTVAALLAKDPAQRPQDASLVARQLEAAAPSFAGTPALPPLSEPPPPHTVRQETVIGTRAAAQASPADELAPRTSSRGLQRGAVVAIIALLVLVLGGGVTAFALMRNSGTTPAAATASAPQSSAAPPTWTSASETSASASKTSDPRLAVPSVVGQPQAQGQAALVAAGFQVQVKPKSDDTAADGSVTAQNPAAGTPALIGSTVTLTVAQHMPGTYLSTLQPIASGGGNSPQVQAASLNGQSYAHAITDTTSCNTPVTVQYNLGRAYQKLTVTVGLRDDSDSKALVQFDILVDNAPKFSGVTRLGQALPVSVDVSNGLRLDIEATRTEKNCNGWGNTPVTTAVWADALLLGGPPAPATPTG